MVTMGSIDQGQKETLKGERQGEEVHTSPQKVVSKTMLLFMKWESILHPLPENRATGAPQLAGFGAPLLTFEGMLARGKK